MKLKWTRLALQDMQYLHDYIAEDNPIAARKMVSRLFEAVQKLKKHPGMGRAGRCEGTRELILAKTPYIVVCAVKENEIQIVAVIHVAMRWPESLPPEES